MGDPFSVSLRSERALMRVLAACVLGATATATATATARAGQHKGVSCGLGQYAHQFLDVWPPLPNVPESGQHRAPVCAWCPPGKFNGPVTSSGSRTSGSPTSCAKCARGMYSYKRGMNLCLKCPFGRLAEEPGQPRCVMTCPGGKYVSLQGIRRVWYVRQ